MIDYKTALGIVLKKTHILSTEKLRVADALGRYTSEKIHSRVFLPEFDNSAMDGYAVSYRFIKGASRDNPVLLRIKGEVSAGQQPEKAVISGMTTVKIFTGAPIPRGADAVVKVEETELIKTPAAEFVKIYGPVKIWENVRFRGENVKPGDLILWKGSRIRPQEIGMLLQAGITAVRVGCRPRVAIIATGDELVQPGRRTGPGKIINVNSYTIAGEATLAGAIPQDMGIARDNPADIRLKIRRALKRADVVIISAGISVGEHDYVKKVLAELGVKEIFWKVAQRPGEPLYFGIYGSGGKTCTLVFGLPGNTVSGIVCFKEYVRPALLKMQGALDFLPVEINAYLEEAVNVKLGRRYFLRGEARLEDGKYFVKTTGEQGSGILKSMVDANCLIVIPENIRALGPGQIVRIQLI